MSRDVDKLIEPFRTSIKELIKKANDAGIPAFVTDTTRTLAEQKELVRKGFSKTLKSKHLIGEAADIAFQVQGKLSYASGLYEGLYRIAKEIPYVIWPYRDLGWLWDKPHFQYDKNKKVVDNDGMELKDCLIKVRELNTEIDVTTGQRDERDKHIERIEDALGISKTGDVEKILETIGTLTKENGRVTDQRDECLRGDNSKLAAIWQIIKS